MENHQIDFDLGLAAWGRPKTVSILQGQCDKCGYGQRVLISTDSSDGEYGSIICVINLRKNERHNIHADLNEDAQHNRNSLLPIK